MRFFLRINIILCIIGYGSLCHASFTSTTLQKLPEHDVVKDVSVDSDPFEGFNRAMTFFNEVVDGIVFTPLVELYDIVAPDPFKESVHNVLSNAATPYTLINDLLQGEAQRAENSFGRFIANTFFGLAGVFDVAKNYFDIPAHTEDFGQTLAVWGADEGAYIVLPIFGPSTVRDTVGLVGGFFLDPTTWVLLKTPKKRYIGRRWLNGYNGATLIDRRTSAIPVVDYIQQADDSYARARSLYEQNREFEIKNGVVDYESPSPDNETSY